MHVLTEAIWFPPVDEALPDGLLAIGGDLSVERLLLAYGKGIFPWYEGDIPLWWSPDPRFVLFPDEIKVSKSMNALLKNNVFHFTIDNVFREVIKACKETERLGQNGTWITDDVEQAYNELHKMGYAHSAEVWYDNKLAGGLYGVRLGNLFFGESMFSYVSNASKYAFIKYIELLEKTGIRLIDCQVYTDHLATLGARMIDRNMFLKYLQDV